MKKLFLLFFLLLVAISLTAQEDETLLNPFPKEAFKAGEWLEFRIHYGVFNASRVTLELQADTLDRVPFFHATGYGRTTGLARLFFKVEDHYQSYFGQKDGLPRWFIRDINEGGYTKDLEIRFNHNTKTAFVNDKKNNRKGDFTIKDNVQDLISAFYYLRNYYDTSHLTKGEEVLINMFFDEENYPFKLRFLGREKIETKFGRIKTLKFRPFVQSGRVFNEQESVTLWISDDDNKVPIKVRANLRIGSIECDLENFKNLRHPFKIEIY